MKKLINRIKRKILYLMFDITLWLTIKQVNRAEKLKLTNSQEFLNYLDKLNEQSVKF